MKRDYVLYQKKALIGFQKSNVIPSIISAVSTLITFLCKDDFPNLLVKVLMLVVVFISFSYSIYLFINNSLKRYNFTSLYYDIESLDDSKVHVFNIIVQKYNNKTGKYLQFYNESWKCRLFPNYKSISKYKKGELPSLEDIKNICKLYQEDTGIKIYEKSLIYKGEMDDFKFSENDKINKHYVFRFFFVNNNPADNIPENKFEYGGKKYYWMTIPEMLKDKNIRKKNRAVVEYVKSFTTSS